MAPSSEERPKLSVSFSGSHSPKLMVSIPINQSVCYGLMGMENASLVEQELENNTDNFVHSLLEGTAINLIMKCEGR